jgi:Leucine-rich repeat (LRR) protein
MHCYVAEILWAGWNSITGTLPSELFELPNIRDIHLAYNYISGSIPENIGQAKSLGMSYCYTNMPSINHSQIHYSQQLAEALHLFDMENMTGTIPDSLYNLTKLKDLWLYNNQFEGSIKSEIGNLKELVHFSIYSNQFTGTIPSELGRCEKLGE